ncbi:glycosyl hydrolase, family 31 [Oesophagostomum dentatum]|uniref:Maltase n=1 Tax=Oesophagostomum dentatum TaxID=61180 RepID=A0A0B1T2L2_OESDE|nr:glycosyl hydrolase, family 31 [Oesophagostomum dentatum]
MEGKICLQLSTDKGEDFFYFKVTRKSTQTVLFDTSLGGLIFSDKFIQIAANLPSDKMYGWGENVHPNLKHDFTRYTTWAIFARDEWPDSDGLKTKNLYGQHPFYMMLEPDGKAHGVFILNSNAQEVTTAPGPALIYRTIGGILDMYFFPGPTPEEVTKQYLALIGKPALPAYWALGYQLSRWGYKSLDEMKEIVERNVAAGIPLDTIVADIDYMDKRKDFTLGEKWTGLPDYVKNIHSRGMKSIVIYDPAIQVDYEAFQRASDMGAKFVEWERDDQVPHDIQDIYNLTKNTKIMLGVVWPDHHTAFPDFFDKTTARWWSEEIARDQKKIGYDGIWIDMNEPANFGTNEDHPWYFDDPAHDNVTTLKCPVVEGGRDAEWDMPPYKTRAVWGFEEANKPYLSTVTLCMNGIQSGGEMRFYNVKSLYGWSESKVTQQALHDAINKRGIVISRSTFASSSRYAAHWLGDNRARWDDLRNAVVGAQEFNLFGFPYVNALQQLLLGARER